MTNRSFPNFLRTANDPAGNVLQPSPLVVFHHFPKTAGSTFRRLLESLFEPDEVCPAEIDDEVKAALAEHPDRFRLFGGHFSYDLLTEHLADAVWLTFLRHPVERVVSNYYNVTDPARYTDAWRERAAARPEVQEFLNTIAGMSLEEFVYFGDPRARDRVVNRQTRYLVKCCRPATYPKYDAAMLAKAKANLRDRFAFVGVQEDFALSLQLFAMTFGIRPFGDVDAFKANLNPKKTGGRYDLSPEVRQYLEDHNQMDLELWRFGRELLQERLGAYHDHFLREDAWWRRQRRRLEPAPRRRAARGKLNCRIDQVAHRRGFHRLERDGLRRPFCWSGYEDPAVLEMQVEVPDHTDLELRVIALSSMDQAVTDSVRMTFDDREVGDLAVSESRGRIIYAGRVRTASPAFPRHNHAIKVYGGRRLEPDHAEHRRLLGIAVHAVEVAWGSDGRA